METESPYDKEIVRCISIDWLMENIKAKKITLDSTIICSCDSGRETTQEFPLFKWYLGYPSVKIYERSFTEWFSHLDNPTVVGKERR